MKNIIVTSGRIRDTILSASFSVSKIKILRNHIFRTIFDLDQVTNKIVKHNEAGTGKILTIEKL